MPDGRVKANWLAIRTYFLAGHSAEECARKFGISTRQIERRRASEGWAQKRRDHVADASAKLDKIVQVDFDAKILDHEEFVTWAAKVARDIDEDLRETNPGRSRAEIRRIGIEAAERVVKMSRLVRGIHDGQPSAATEQSDDVFRFEDAIDPEADAEVG